MAGLKRNTTAIVTSPDFHRSVRCSRPPEVGAVSVTWFLSAFIDLLFIHSFIYVVVVKVVIEVG